MNWWDDLLLNSITAIIGGAVGAATAWAVFRATRQHERKLFAQAIHNERRLAMETQHHELRLAAKAILGEKQLSATDAAQAQIQRLVEVCVATKQHLLSGVGGNVRTEETDLALTEQYWQWIAVTTLAISAASRFDRQFGSELQTVTTEAAGLIYQLSLNSHEPILRRRTLIAIDNAKDHATGWLGRSIT